MPAPTTPLEPSRTALLVMDYQAGIVAMLAEPDALLDRARRAIEIARRAGASVGFVRVGFTPEARSAIPDRNKSFSQVAASQRMALGAPDVEIHESVAPAEGDIVVTKTRVGAFSTTDLAEQLASRGIDTLVLAGISTSGVVLSTLRDAADHDYRLLVLSDACADLNDEVHRVLVEQVYPRQADVITVDDLAGILGPAPQ